MNFPGSVWQASLMQKLPMSSADAPFDDVELVQNVCKLCAMTAIPISEQGTITLTTEMRRHLGIDRIPNAVFLVEEHPDGLYLRVSTAVPVRNIPEETIAGWIKEDEESLKAAGLDDLLPAK
jgi:hypothetical protein